MKKPFFIKTGLLLFALTFSLEAWPSEVAYDSFLNDHEEGQIEMRDWDDLRDTPYLDESSSLSTEEDDTDSSNSTPPFARLDERERAIAQHRKNLALLSMAFRKAYERGDEHHSDWEEVVKYIDALRPVDGIAHVERRLSPDCGREAESEELQYHFLHETLLAIKKTSVVEAWRSSHPFETGVLLEKIATAQAAWEQAGISFESACEDSVFASEKYHAPSNLDSSMDYHPSSFDAYIMWFKYQSERLEIENQLNKLHHQMAQKIIEAKVSDVDFEKRIGDQSEADRSFQAILKKIQQNKTTADSAFKHKWEKVYQKEARDYLEGLAQVDKIKLWKQENQIRKASKVTKALCEQAAERCAQTTQHIDSMRRVVLKGKITSEAEQNKARIATNRNEVEQRLKQSEKLISEWAAHEKQSKNLQNYFAREQDKLELMLETNVEKEMETWVSDVQQKLARWKALTARLTFAQNKSEIALIGKSAQETKEQIFQMWKHLKQDVTDKNASSLKDGGAAYIEELSSNGARILTEYGRYHCQLIKLQGSVIQKEVEAALKKLDQEMESLKCSLTQLSKLQTKSRSN